VKVKVYNLERKAVGDLDLDDEVWGAEVKQHLLHEVVTAQRASRRQGTQATKERSAVSGTNKKLYRQKGTGQARQGGKRAPHRVGGGHAHELQPRDYGYRPPRKVRLGALKCALSLFAKEERLLVLENLTLAETKTKALAKTFDALQVGGKVVVVDNPGNQNLELSIRNMKDKQFLLPDGVNVFDLLRHRHLVVTREAALAIQKRFAEKE
jgi:large subunit ribosomal protein L4